MTRRSKRELARAVDDLDGGNDLPEAGLITLLGAEQAGECEWVDGEPDLVRCYGDLYRVSPTINERFGGSP